MVSGHGARAALAAVLVAAGLLLPGAGARAAMTEPQLRERIAEAYGVRVLKVTAARIDGRAAFIVTVMNPGGNYNEAYQVGRLAVDAETGALIPSFRHHPTGYEPSDSGTQLSTPEPTDTLRPSANGAR